MKKILIFTTIIISTILMLSIEVYNASGRKDDGKGQMTMDKVK
jgi:hypothetical protein